MYVFLCHPLSHDGSYGVCIVDVLNLVAPFPQGYAYTFITDDQARYGGEIVKALELSGSPVPPELEKLWSSFKDQQKAVRTHCGTQ